MRKHKKRREWHDWLESAKKYKNTYGDLLIPSKYITPDGYKLGRWIERQRAIYNGNSKITGVLYLDQVAALDSLGMVWKLENRFTWKKWLDLCDAYIKENGNLNVPKSYVVNNIRLGYWITKQRQKYHNGDLTKTQIDDLNERKMIWSFGYRRSWDDWFEDAKNYYISHNDLLVPVNYVTSDGNYLGRWISSQRIKRNKNNDYPDEYIYRLNSIGMIWNMQFIRDDDWERMFIYVESFVDENGKLPLWPKRQLAPDGRTMDGWINVQRTRLVTGNIPDWQRQKLNDIGIYPFGAN